jgi:hypothetical protein
MKFKGLCSLRDSEGKGLFGCMVFLVLFLVALFVLIKLAPVYYSNYNMESDLKTEVSRAGAHSFDDETIIRDIQDLAKKNEIQLDRDNIKIQRMAGQVQIEVSYSVPVDFIILQRDLSFTIKGSSFIGSI